MTFRVGTSGYNYAESKGTFYPADLPASKMLAYYVERFSTVEINATFYRMPNARTLAGWRDAEVYALLRPRNAALCIADTEAGATPAVATADWGYARLRAEAYGDDDLRRWIATLRGVGAGWREAFVFFKHEVGAPRLAAAFHHAALTHG